MDKLDEIMAHKRVEISGSIRPVHDRELEKLGELRSKHAFKKSLLKKDRLSVIAEIKRKSPSAGDIAALASAEEQAITYLNAGADCMSILTDQKYFGGTIKDLWEVTDLVSNHRRNVPCLRKDFMLDPIQVVEAAEAGAAAILIIVRALTDDQIKRLYDAARLANLDSLFEVHTEAELEKALKFSPEIIGVNNRDLQRFSTNLEISETIIPQIPDHIAKISESGIWYTEDAERAAAAGADAILVGESLMRAEDVEELMSSFHNCFPA